VRPIWKPVSPLIHFEEKGADTKKKLYVAFVSKELRAENSNDLKISQFKPDEAHLDGNRVLLNMR
jgi:hypothetical protein